VKFLVRLDLFTGRHLKTMKLFGDKLTKIQRLLKFIKPHNKRLKLKMHSVKLRTQPQETWRKVRTLIHFLKNS
jgi:hypothetical protein